MLNINILQVTTNTREPHKTHNQNQFFEIILTNAVYIKPAVSIGLKKTMHTHHSKTTSNRRIQSKVTTMAKTYHMHINISHALQR